MCRMINLQKVHTGVIYIKIIIFKLDIIMNLLIQHLFILAGRSIKNLEEMTIWKIYGC